jgi:hypothetical protein
MEVAASHQKKARPKPGFLNTWPKPRLFTFAAAGLASDRLAGRPDWLLRLLPGF